MKKDLTKGRIFDTLVKLALPIMGTSFLQMAYNMTDMIWLGRVGSDAVASAGTAGFYMWFSFAFIVISKVGAEIKVAMSIGKQEEVEAEKYSISAFQFNLFLAVVYSIIMLLFRNSLINFFNIDNPKVNLDAINYLSIVSFGMIFPFTNLVLTGIFNGYGDSKKPFLFNTIGLVVNMILDPVLILKLNMGVRGAAIATVFSQFIVFGVFLYYIKSGRSILGKIKLFQKAETHKIKEMIKLGFPVAIQSGLFTFFSMYIAKIIAFWGPIAIAAQKVGSQIESISWMTAGGFQGALSAFTGQNYGAHEYERIKKGYYSSILIMGVIGLIATLGLFFFAEEIFSIFIPEKETILIGKDYLIIISLSQIFMCLEITTAGAFNGIGKTLPPSIISIAFNALRIPTAFFLAKKMLLGLNGVWWSISISSVFKGSILVIWFFVIIKNNFYVKKELT